MISEIHIKSDAAHARSDRERAVINSALWATAGDALGWITELSRGRSGVAHRAGVDEVSEPIEWQRLIGGRGGPRVDLPAGTYSDDTQLRLAVCRSIRGDGSFDPETFAKIEITVWPTYALGGGLGTKAAAANLAKRSVNWFSNFFDSAGQRYVNGGGNGAAMRIQPHVWASSRSTDAMLLHVLKDALVTHGHPHGFCGAIFHALCLSHALRTKVMPTPSDWREFVRSFSEVPRLIELDPQLTAFWQSAWENDVGLSVSAAISQMQDEALGDLETVEKLLNHLSTDSYHAILNATGCLSPTFRGSGFKTALAAASLSYLHAKDSPSVALVKAANELDSDTDTIATMAGSLLGATAESEPTWTIQDRKYITEEAKRLACISLGEVQDSFTYPDLGHWNPPSTQTASVGRYDGKLAIAGLGTLARRSDEYRSGDAIWQWFTLPFGQSILAKRRADSEGQLAPAQLPGPLQSAKRNNTARPRPESATQSSLPLSSPAGNQSQKPPEQDNPGPAQTFQEGIDDWTDSVIQSDFDDFMLGRLLNRCIDQSESIDAAVAFVGIVAKAKLARRRRRRQ